MSIATLIAALLPVAARATNLFTLDSHADTSGPIVTEANGTGYVAWDHPAANPSEPDVVLFCKIPLGGTCTDPITLPLPAGANEEIIQPFPILGSKPDVVYVVGPRYIKDEHTVIWTSTDGGTTFSAPKLDGAAAPGKTNVGDVLLDPNTPAAAGPTEDYFGIAFNNPGLGFGFTANEITGGTTSFTFANPGAGGVASSTLGYATHTVEDSGTKQQIYPEIEAYYNLSSPAPEVFFYRYYAKDGIGDDDEGGWEGPIKVSDGYVPRLAGGPKGLFLLSTDIAPGESTEAQPSAIDVRKFNETTHTFEAPVMVAKIPTSAGTLFNSGDIYENPETGALYVAQPVIDSEGAYVMRLWESTDGGQTFHGERDVAAIGPAYTEIPRLAVAAGGHGWLTFRDAGGLEVANLVALPTTPLAEIPPAPSPTPAPTTLTTTQTSGTTTGASISISAGTVGESDRATIAGANASAATGTVDFALYEGSCSGKPLFSGAASVVGGAASISYDAGPGLLPDKYYWEATYSGNASNNPSTSACGSEVLTVTPAATIEGKGESTSTTVTITITCASTPCTVTITLTITQPTASKASVARKSKHRRMKTVTLGTETFTVKTKGPHKLTVHLSKAGKKYLSAHHGRLNANTLVSEKTPGGTELTTRTIAIAPTKPKHRK